MAAGWSVLGACYTTSQQVVNAFTAIQAPVFVGNIVYLHTPANVTFNAATGYVTYTVFNDYGTNHGIRNYPLNRCDTDYTPTPANAVITGGNGNGTGIVQPPLTSVTPNTKFSSMGQEDVILICAVLFACLFGFNSGVTTGKGIAK